MLCTHDNFIVYLEFSIEQVRAIFRKYSFAKFWYTTEAGIKEARVISNLGLRMNTLLYKDRNYKCASCSLKANKFLLEQHKTREGKPSGAPYLNLYYKQGEEHILFTVDHIVPKCLKGPNIPINLQLMCCKCNNRKGDRIETEFLNSRLIQKMQDLNPRLFEGLSSKEIASFNMKGSNGRNN